MRTWRRSSIAGVLVGLLGLYPLLAPPAHRIDKDHFELIQNGMTLADVESIFGQPAGNYDWAVADDARVWSFALTKLSVLSAIPDIQADVVVLNEMNVDVLAQVGTPNAAKLGKRQTVIWTNLGAQIRSADTMGWTSRHGACTLWFDQHGRVSHKSEWAESRIVPPWQTWWKKLFGE
jgi:hypothetical protein